jgi:nucleoside-diphosphate kinase
MDKMTLEKTLVFVKPGNGNFKKRLEILAHLGKLLGKDAAGYFPTLVNPVPEEIIRKHYENIKGKSFYEPTIKAYLDSDGILLRVYFGNNIISRIRNAIGHTDPKKAKPRTIRNVFGNDSFAEAYRERRYLNNVIHASENKKEAERELNIWKDYINLE